MERCIEVLQMKPTRQVGEITFYNYMSQPLRILMAVGLCEAPLPTRPGRLQSNDSDRPMRSLDGDARRTTPMLVIAAPNIGAAQPTYQAAALLEFPHP
jgi:hypothetical protein